MGRSTAKLGGSGMESTVQLRKQYSNYEIRILVAKIWFYFIYEDY
jgi:hypothetical protein